MSVAAKSIYNLLASPSKVAHSLDWKKASGAVLSLRIVKDRIDLAVSSHPELDEPTHDIPSIPLEYKTINNRKVLMPKVARELTDVIHQYNVCGMVVSWPIQSEGWCGKSCGKVLHTLDQMAADLPKRPIALFDPKHVVPPEDQWGRAKLYSEPVDKNMHVASKDQYPEECTTTTGKLAADIWDQFCQEHWPDIQEAKSSSSSYAALAAGKQTLSPAAKHHQYTFDYLQDKTYATAAA